MAGFDRIRGMTDLPLTSVGVAQAEHLAARIAHKGGVENVMTSPLLRARQSAAAILRHNPRAKMLGTSKGLLPWASGVFEGAPIDVVHDEMAHYIRNPSTPFPGVSPTSGVPGESRDQYWKGRLAPHIINRVRNMKPGERAFDVTHYRDIRTARAWLQNGAKPDLSLDEDELARKDHTEPGSVYKVSLNPPRIDVVDMKDNSILQPAYYMGRHGSTMWSKEDNTGEGLSDLRQTPHGLNILKHLGLGLGRSV